MQKTIYVDFWSCKQRPRLVDFLWLSHSGLKRNETFDILGDFDRDFDTFVPNYGNKYQLEGRNPDLDEKKIDFLHQLLL